MNLGLEEEVTNEKDSEGDSITRVCSWLQTRTNWLLLLDNVSDDMMTMGVFKHLPRTGGDIILTTRGYVPSSKATVIHVDKMQEAEATFLLLSVSSMDSIDQESSTFRYAQEIVAQLDSMPLAIDLARAYVKNTQTSVQHYLDMLKTKRDILFQYQDKGSSGEYNHTVATVWRSSLECLQIQCPAAVEILKACAFFQSENIPVSFFEHQYRALSLLPALPEREEDSEQSREIIREAIAVLVKYSFVTRTLKEVDGDKEDPKSDLLNIHRLVQKVIYDAMDSQQMWRWAHNIVVALNDEISFVDSYAPHTRNIMGAYLSHIRHFIKMQDGLSQNPLESEDGYFLLHRSAAYLLDYEMYFGVEDLVQLCVRVSEALYGPEDSYTITSLAQLITLYSSQGKRDKVEPLRKRILAIEKKLGSEDLSTVVSLTNQAVLYKDQGKYDKAELLHQRALEISKKTLGSEHLETALSQNNLGALYINLGKYDEAEPLFQRALVIREKLVGSEHPDTASSLNSLGELHVSRGKYNEAEPFFKRALAIRKKVLGSEHSDVVESLNNLAGLYMLQGKYDAAKPLQQRALAISEKRLGLEHPDTVRSLRNMAIVYEGQGDYKNAELQWKRSLPISEKVSKSEHPDTATSLENLALLYQERGKYEEAESLFRRALAICQKAFGSEHEDTMRLLDSLASLYQYQDKYDEAESLFKRALAVKEKLLGSEHPDIAIALNYLAKLYSNQEKYDLAEPLFKQALVINEKSLGPEHPYTAMSLKYLARLCQFQNRFDEAVLLCKLALMVNKKALGSKHPSTIETEYYLEFLKTAEKCNVCRQKATKLCSKCKVVWYCTKEHQKADWIEHKRVCGKV